MMVNIVLWWMWWTCTAATSAAGAGHGFWRVLRRGVAPHESRRIFGGAATQLTVCPTVCALLDRYWSVRCSGSILSPNWALTAGHCVTPGLAYIKYNTDSPSDSSADVSPIHYLYKHPNYMATVVSSVEGEDVSTLHHDVGLVRSRRPMEPPGAPPPPPLRPLAAPANHDDRLHQHLQHTLLALAEIDAQDLTGQTIEVYGFGVTEGSGKGEKLFSARMEVAECQRDGWMHCACARAPLYSEARGVCAGDSGGPVVFRGQQVGVTSMGPLECARSASPPGDATSVFTTLRQYVPLLNATVLGTDRVLRMRMIWPEFDNSKLNNGVTCTHSAAAAVILSSLPFIFGL